MRTRASFYLSVLHLWSSVIQSSNIRKACSDQPHTAAKLARVELTIHTVTNDCCCAVICYILLSFLLLYYPLQL